MVDSHVDLPEPARFGYAWTKGAPALNRQVPPGDLMTAAAPVEIDQFLFDGFMDNVQELATAAQYNIPWSPWSSTTTPTATSNASNANSTATA